MILQKLTNDELEFLEDFHDSTALAECLFSNFDNLTEFSLEKFGHLRTYQIPLLSHEYIIDTDVPGLSPKDKFRLLKGAGDLFIYGARKFGKCEDENSECLLSDGTYVKYKDLVGKKRKVISFNSETLQLEESVAEFFDNGIRDCYLIITKSGKNIVITEQHPLFTQDGWKKCRDLKVSDFLATPKTIHIKNTKKVDINVAKIIGYLLGDGSCSTPTVAFTNINDEIIKEYKDLIDYFKCDLRCDGISFFAKAKIKKITKNNIQKLVLKYNINKLSKYKTIPDEVFRWDNKYIAILLNRLFACDAHVNKKNYTIELTLASKKMVYQVASLLLRFGIHSSIYQKKPIKKDDKEFNAWRLFISNDFDKFIKLIGIKSKDNVELRNKQYSTSDRIPQVLIKNIYSKLKFKKKLRLRSLLKYNPSRNKLEKINKTLRNSKLLKIIDANIFWDEIKEIKYVGKRRTVAVSVPKNNTYISNNIISHNTLIVEILDLLISFLHLSGTWVAFASVDLVHIRSVLDRVKAGLESHPFLRQWKKSIKASTAEYKFQLRNNYLLESVNFNRGSKNPGNQWYGKHVQRVYIEEASLETEKVADKRKDALSELGAVFRVSGMTNFTRYSPPGQTFYDKDLKNKVINYPQYINPMWDEEEKKKRLKAYGSEGSIGYRLFVKGEVVEEGVSAIDMERVVINEEKAIKFVEINKNNFKNFEQVLIVEKPRNATRVFIATDVSDIGTTEIAIFFEINNKYYYSYNITLRALDDEQHKKLFKWLMLKVEANVCGVDATDAMGRVLVRYLQREFGEEHAIPVGFNEKIKVDFEKDENTGNAKRVNGKLVYKMEYVSEWSVRWLIRLLYDMKLVLPLDYKLEVQLSSVNSFQSGMRTVYKCLAKEDHLFQAFQVFAILHWNVEFANIDPVNKKPKKKWGVGA